MTQTRTPTIEIPETNPNVAQPVVLETPDTEAPQDAFHAFAAIDPHTYEDRQRLLTAGVTTKQPRIAPEAPNASNAVGVPKVESKPAAQTSDPVEASQDAFHAFAGANDTRVEADRQRLLPAGGETSIGNVALKK